MNPSEKWVPTPDNINALPEGIRKYIHDLEARCDPGGDVQSLAILRENEEALALKVQELDRSVQATDAQWGRLAKVLGVQEGETWDPEDRIVAMVEELKRWKTWEDKRIPEDEIIDAFHPTRNGRDDLYLRALELVSAKHGKYELVGLVNWLLHMEAHWKKSFLETGHTEQCGWGPTPTGDAFSCVNDCPQMNKEEDALRTHVDTVEELDKVRAELKDAQALIQRLESPKVFPIQGSSPIPWEMAQRAYDTYVQRFGKEQSLERLAQRGGFGLQEFACLFAGHDPYGCQMQTKCREGADAVGRQLAKMKQDVEEIQQLFEVQHRRTLEAMKLWQKAHNKPEIWPDLGELVKWLVERGDTAERQRDGLRLAGSNLVGYAETLILAHDERHREMAVTGVSEAIAAWHKTEQEAGGDLLDRMANCEVLLRTVGEALLVWRDLLRGGTLAEAEAALLTIEPAKQLFLAAKAYEGRHE